MRIWSKFSKTGPAVFMSHLDLVRVMERSARRANLPIAFSRGYHPRPKLAFGPALSLGISSSGEYLDIELLGEMDLNEFIFRLESALPKGLNILKACKVSSNVKSLSSLIDTASYNVKVRYSSRGSHHVPLSYDDLKGELISFLELPEFFVERQVKGGKRRVINIAGLVEGLKISEHRSESILLEMLLPIGTRGVVRPEEVISAVFTKIEGIEFEIANIHRNELFITIQDGRRRISPIEYSFIVLENLSGS